MLTLKNVTIGLLVLLATALSIWSILMAKPSQGNTAANPKEPDSYMLDVVATTYNDAGRPSLKLTTPQMVHYPENNSTRITAPRVTVYRKFNTQPWFIDSDYANASHGTEQITFIKNVNIHHLADETNPNTSLLTESLTIFPDKKLATTDKPVTFIQPDTIVRAVGMLANLNDNTVKLLSQAQGEYAPSS